MANIVEFPRPTSCFQTLNIDGKSIGDTDLFTSVDGGGWWIIAASFLTPDAVAVVTPPTVSIGTNSPNFNDVMPATVLTGLTSSNQTITVPITTAAQRIPASAGTTFTLRVSVAANATSYTFSVTVIGIVGIP